MSFIQGKKQQQHLCDSPRNNGCVSEQFSATKSHRAGSGPESNRTKPSNRIFSPGSLRNACYRGLFSGLTFLTFTVPKQRTISPARGELLPARGCRPTSGTARCRPRADPPPRPDCGEAPGRCCDLYGATSPPGRRRGAAPKGMAPRPPRLSLPPSGRPRAAAAV